MNLDLGGGPRKRPGFLSVDALSWDGATDILADLESVPWPFNDGAAAQVFSRHFLEHLPWHRLPAYIAECYRILKPGGLCTHIFPEVLRVMALAQYACKCVEGDVFTGKPDCPICHGQGKIHPDYVKSSLCGQQEYPGDVHRNVIWGDEMVTLMRQAGFVCVQVQTVWDNPACCEVVGVKLC